ncbi:hypothetical protein J3R83DRAFT_9799 [Lanmaoa asiatica]|nr:hypothetical protein J3R83DRAFT_9799 [Lanmaoa asiatica]
MDQIPPQDHQQKDFLAFLFPDSSLDQNRPQDAHPPDVLATAQLAAHRTQNTLQSFPGSNNTAFNHQPLDLMAMSNLMSLDATPTTLPSTAPLTPQMLLEQQYKLTQLHQLQQLQNQIQNQIFQQQASPLLDITLLALISGQTTLATHDTNPDPQRDPVSPFNGLPTPLSSTEIRPTNPDFLSRLNPPFQNNQQSMYHSHALDNMPLLSPQDPSASPQYMRHQGSVSAPANIAFPSFPSPSDLDISPLTSPWLEAYPHPPNTRPAKRTASPSVDETARVSRKRHTPTVPTSTKVPRNVKSATSTPLLRSTRGRRNSSICGTDSAISALPTQEEVRMTPVTPASIMNLGRLGVSSSLAPATQPSRAEKGKESAKIKDTTSIPKASRRAGLPLISPGPKPILPAGSAISLNSSSAVSPPAPITRKSHKDAEQKRRDSLKTAYDDLRTLLPPVPLPSDDNFPDEPILPGALPPRGPPKAGSDGPNKGVSKLQLLRCGNDYIRTLNGRVDRRDTEIAALRREVLRLRAFAGEEAQNDDVDIDRDLDAVEAGHPRLGLSVLDEEGDDGEE